MAPTKALIQERVNDWSKRFGHLQLSIVECTGDSAEAMDLTQADVIATTPYVMTHDSNMSLQRLFGVYMQHRRDPFRLCGWVSLNLGTQLSVDAGRSLMHFPGGALTQEVCDSCQM